MIGKTESKPSLVCLFLIPLVNPNKRINKHENGFDVLRSEEIRIFLSIKVFNPLDSVKNHESKKDITLYQVLI